MFLHLQVFSSTSLGGDERHVLFSASTESPGSQRSCVLQTWSWCLCQKQNRPLMLEEGPLSTEHRNYSFSFTLTGHSFCRSSVTVVLMKNYGSGLCPCPPTPCALSRQPAQTPVRPPLTSSSSSFKDLVTHTSAP